MTGNSSEYGGGVHAALECNPAIDGCVLWANTANFGSQIRLGAWWVSSGIDPNTGAIIWRPLAPELVVSYSDVQGGQDAISTDPNYTLIWRPSNVDTDPCFVEPGRWADVNDPNQPAEPNDPNAVWVDGDYHLLSDSPCINAGDPNHLSAPNETDIDGQPRIFDDRIDMGAYEFVPAVECRVAFLPRVMNRNSRAKRIIGLMLLPDGMTKDQISGEKFVLYPGVIEAERQMILPRSPRQARRTMVICFFERDALLAAVPDDGRAELQLTGSLNDGRRCCGSGTVWIRSSGRLERFWRPWQQRRR
jgi:hypothetical protein